MLNKVRTPRLIIQMCVVSLEAEVILNYFMTENFCHHSERTCTYLKVNLIWLVGTKYSRGDRGGNQSCTG